MAGDSKYAQLGQRVYPFLEFRIHFTGGASLTLLRWRQNAAAFAAVTLGSYPNVVAAIKAIAFTPTLFGYNFFEAEATDSAGRIRFAKAQIVSEVRLQFPKFTRVNQKIRPFADVLVSLSNSHLDSARYRIDGGSWTNIPAAGDLLKAIGDLQLSFGATGKKRVELGIKDTALTESIAGVDVMVA